MNRNHIIPILALAVCPNALQAKVINQNEARAIATQFINLGTQPQMKAFKVQGNTTNASAPDFYVLNDKNGNGFVLIAGDDCVSPVLGYSHTGKADVNNMPPALKAWLENISQYISSQRLKNGGVAKTYSSKVTDNPGTPVVEPIIKTHWSQEEPYFNQTPTINGEHTVTCCVATAMAQVFNYYKYPVHGNGVLDYATPNYDQDRINIDLSKSTYDWGNMLNDYTTDDNGTNNWNDAQATAISTLMRDIGAALHVIYNTSDKGGSGAYSEDIRTAAARNFGYMATTYYKTNYSMKQWVEMLRKRFDEGNPVVICGTTKTELQDSGHSFVGDGYDSNDNIHINWGWAGNYDGYYNFYKFGPENYNFNVSMDFTEFSKDESGDAAKKIEQPIVTAFTQQFVDNNMSPINKSVIKMDADKINVGISVLAYCASWDKYDGRLKVGLYDKEGNTQLGNVGEEQALNNDFKDINHKRESKVFLFKPEDFADIKDGNYQLLLLSNNTSNNDNWVQLDNGNILGLEKNNGSIILTLSMRDTGHLTQKGELKFDKDTYDLSEIATFSVNLANNSKKDFGGEVYAHIKNADDKNNTNDLQTGLNAMLFSGDEAEITGGQLKLTPRNNFKPGKYEVTLWQYCDGKPVLLINSQPTTINIVENPKKQPTLLVNKMTATIDDEEIEVNPGDILNMGISFPVLSFDLSWKKPEIETKDFTSTIYCDVKVDGETKGYPNIFFINSLDNKHIDEVVNGYEYEIGSTCEFSIIYDSYSVAEKYLQAKYRDTDKDASIKIHWTDEPTDIRNLNSSCTRVVGRWNAQGMKLSKPESGLNIVRYSDGSVRKVIVK